MKKFYLLSVLLWVFNAAFSQQTGNKIYFSVKGKVSDESGIAINAASIKIKGKGYGGIITNRDGSYTLNNVLEGDSILFTHIAYKAASFKVQGNNIINAELKRNTYHFSDFEITDTAERSTQPRVAEGFNDHILEKVEVMASYKGGRKGMSEYFKKTIKYPEDAKKKNIEGVVVIGFFVDRDNKVKDVKVVKGISPDCDEVAVNAVKNMTDWICAIQNGRGVDVYIEVSITFSLVTLTAG